MSDPDAAMNFLESQIPGMSGSAFDVAYLRALATGQRVLVSGTDGIYMVEPDGTRTLVTPAAPRLRVQAGMTVRLP